MSTGSVRGQGHGQVGHQLWVSFAEAKPHLRGWLHLGIVPLALAGGVVLVALAPTTTTRIGAVVFAASALLLFGVSAVYHRGTWSPRAWHVLRQLDHCNIFVLIAGSCTAYALLLLETEDLPGMLVIVWASAALGVLARFVWPGAPPWVSPPIYVACGWGVLVYLPGLLGGAARLGPVPGTATIVLLGAGGVLYTAGAVVYGLQWPDPWPRWFGFHEVFHTLTILAFASHYSGIVVATVASR